jgi:splicing factor 3B subunit 4
MRDPDTGNSKGFAFVNFASFEASDNAIEAMNSQYLCNRPISVSYAFKKEAKGERHGSAAERLLAAQNPLSKASLPHQLFADAPVAQINSQPVMPIRAPVPAGKTVSMYVLYSVCAHIHSRYYSLSICCSACTVIPPIMPTLMPPPAPPAAVPPPTQPTEIPRPMQFPAGLQLPPGIRPPPGIVLLHLWRNQFVNFQILGFPMPARIMAGMPGQIQPGLMNMMGGGMPEGCELFV